MGASKSKPCFYYISTPKELKAAIDLNVNMKKLSKSCTLYLIDSFDLDWNWRIIYNRNDLEEWFVIKHCDKFITTQGF